MKYKVLMIILLDVIGLLTACNEAAISPQEVGDLEHGRVLFENGGSHEMYKPTYICANCHSLDGSDGDGPSLQGISQRAGSRVSELSAEAYIRQSILDPDAYVIEGYNHKMGRIFSVLLSEKEVDDLVAFLLTQ